MVTIYLVKKDLQFPVIPQAVKKCNIIQVHRQDYKNYEENLTKLTSTWKDKCEYWIPIL